MRPAERVDVKGRAREHLPEGVRILPRRAALEDAVDLLSACPDIRLILNDATFSPSGRKFGSYYGYGE